MITNSIGGVGYKRPVYANSTTFKGGNQEAATNVFDGQANDEVQITESAENKKSNKGTVLKVLGGIVGVGAAALLAIFAKKGGVFSKVKNALSGAEGKNIIEKIKSVATKGNAQKAVQALKTGAKETVATVSPKAKELITNLGGKTKKLKDAATPVLETAKEKASTVVKTVKDKATGVVDKFKK